MMRSGHLRLVLISIFLANGGSVSIYDSIPNSYYRGQVWRTIHIIPPCRILGFKPRRLSTVYYSRRVAALRLVLRATLYIYIVNHICIVLIITSIKAIKAVNISE